MNSPQKIGRYEIQGELGRGAMGIVYKALDPNIGRTVALKTMRLDVHGADEEEILKRFKHEAKLAGVLNHPNVVTIYDAGEDQRVFYIAMEFVEGVTLQTLLHQQRVIPAQLMLEVTKQICPAMDFAHTRGIIHRDIKPANIMLTSSGGAKIMDFGIAKAEGGLTSAGQVLGTPAYMSPEQVRGKTLDGRSDLFSYGVCLYEMVTGEKPFTGQNVTTIIYKIMNEQPVPPRELDITIHPGLSEVITRALSKNPDERYQTGKDLAQALETYKDFGSNAEKTQVLSSMAAETAAMPAAQDAQAVTQSGTGSGILKKVRQTATLIGQGASGKGSHAAIESTVTVQQKAVSQSHKIFDPRKIAIMAAALLVVVLGSVAFMKNHKNPDGAQKAGKADVATATQPATNASTPPQTTEPAPVATAPTEDKKDEKKDDAGLIAKDTVTKPAAATAKKPAAAKPAAKGTTASAVTVPPPPVAPEFGGLHVTSTPPGAQVSIDGKSDTEWLTPFTASKLSPGDHDIAFTRQGFTTQKKHTNVTAGKTAAVNAELVAAIAKINIKSTPTGANILLDGSPTGKVTPTTLNVDPGTHKVVIRQPGYQEENTTVTLKDGESYDYAPTLDAVKVGGGKNPFRAMRRMFGGGIPEGQGVVQVETSPPGAEVVFRGKPWPKTTPIRAPLDPGEYKIIVRLQGYKPVVRDFTVEKGKVTEVNVDLQAK